MFKNLFSRFAKSMGLGAYVMLFVAGCTTTLTNIHPSAVMNHNNVYLDLYNYRLVKIRSIANAITTKPCDVLIEYVDRDGETFAVIATSRSCMEKYGKSSVLGNNNTQLPNQNNNEFGHVFMVLKNKCPADVFVDGELVAQQVMKTGKNDTLYFPLSFGDHHMEAVLTKSVDDHYGFNLKENTFLLTSIRYNEKCSKIDIDRKNGIDIKYIGEFEKFIRKQ